MVKTKLTRRLMVTSEKRVEEVHRDLVERFESAYNRADHILREILSKDHTVPFSVLLEDFADRRRFWADKKLLKTAAEVRNFIVHSKIRPHEPLAIPSEALLEDLESAIEKLANPARAIPTFKSDVCRVQSADTIAVVLRTIASRNFSQFPVYDGNTFRGLLTENGITRWLARHVSNVDSMVELSETNVDTVLKAEEARKNWIFVNPSTPVDEMKCLFGEHRLLEAVLITANTHQNEKLLGIATRWDMLR